MEAVRGRPAQWCRSHIRRKESNAGARRSSPGEPVARHRDGDRAAGRCFRPGRGIPGKVGGLRQGDGATFPPCSATSRSYHESIGAPDPDRRRSRPRAAPPTPGARPGPLRREDFRPGKDRAQPHAARQGRLELGRPRLLPRLPQSHPHARRLLDRRASGVPGRYPGRDPPLPDRGGPRQRDPCRPRRLGPVIVVRAIDLDRPRLALKALDDTTANWNITRPDTTKAKTAEAGKPMALSLKRFQLADAHITFDNQAARLKAAIVGLSQTLSGDFSQDQVAVATRAHADTATVEFAGITYLNHVRVDLERGRRGRHGEEGGDPQAERAPAQRPDRGALRLRRVGRRGPRPRPHLRRAQDRLQKHPVAGAGGVRQGLRNGEDDRLAGALGEREGEVREDRLPRVQPPHQGGQRDLPLPGPPAPGAGDLPRPRHHQPGRQRRQHDGQPEPAASGAGEESGGRGPGAAHPDQRSRRGRPDAGDGGSRRPPPHHQAGQRAAARRRVSADAAVRTRMSVRGQGAVRPGGGAGDGGHPRPLGQIEGAAPSARHHPGVAGAGAGAGPAQVVQRNGGEQRSPRLGDAGEPAGLRLPRRRPQGQRLARQQQVRARRVAERRRGADGDPGAAQNRLRA